MPVQCRHCHNTYENYQIRQHEQGCRDKHYYRTKFKGGSGKLAGQAIEKPNYIIEYMEQDQAKLEQAILEAIEKKKHNRYLQAMQEYAKRDAQMAQAEKQQPKPQGDELGVIASRVAQEYLDGVYKDDPEGYNRCITHVKQIVAFMGAQGERYFTRDLANAFQAIAVGLEAALDIGEKEEEEDDDGAWARDRY